MNGKCMDALRNYSQVRTAVFDGGYAFGRPFTDTPILPGYYVVQASPPRGAQGTEVYQVQQEEDKNVDFGDEMKMSPQALPPYCVGGIATDGTILNNGVAPHDAGTTLALFSTPDGPVDIAPGLRAHARVAISDWCRSPTARMPRPTSSCSRDADHGPHPGIRAQ